MALFGRIIEPPGGGVTTTLGKKCAIGLAFFAAACSPNPEAPSFNDPIKSVNVEACRDANLDIRQLDAQKVRSLTTCLNGANGALQEYKDFLDSTTDEDLNQVLEVYNRHINTPNNRLNKILDLAGRMDSKGYLDDAYKNIQVLAGTQSFQKALPLVRHLFSDDKDLMPLVRYVRDVIARDQLTPTLIVGANAGGGLRARVLAILMSRDNPNSVLSVDQVVNLAADIFLRSLNDGGLHAVFAHVSDPQLGKSLKTTPDEEIVAMGDFFDFLPLGTTAGNNRVERLRKVVNGADRPLICYQNGTSSRKSDNVFEFFSREVAQMSVQGAENFFLQTCPLLFATSIESCDFHPDLINNRDLLTEMTLKGYGAGERAVHKLFVTSTRLRELTRLAKSDYMTLMAPLMEEGAVRGASRFGLELALRDLTESDINTLSILLNYFILENLSGESLAQWIRVNVADPSKTMLLNDLNSLPEAQRDFINLSGLVAALPAQDQALRDLKDAVAAKTFKNSAEASFFNIARKIAAQDPERRRELVDFARAFQKSLGDSRGGFGLFTSLLAQTTGLALDRPVQEILHDVFADEALMKKLAPIFYKWLADPKLHRSIDFTGKIAGNGQLKILVKFLVETFRYSQGQGLGNGVPATQYTANTQDAQALVNGMQTFSPVPLQGDYSSCVQLHGSLFDLNGQNLYLGLKCINAAGAAPILETVAEQLKTAGLLDAASQVLKTMLVTSPYMLGFLDQIERIFRSGDLTKILKLVSISGENPYNIPYRLDGILADAFAHGGMDAALQLLGKTVQHPDFTKSGVVLMDLKLQEPQKIFESNNDYRIKITNDPNVIKKMKNQIKEWHSNWNQAQIDAAFAQLVENFEARNDTWLYEEGLYPRLNDAQWKQNILLSLQDSLRTTDLKEIITALQDLHRTYNMPRFLMDSIKSQRIVNNHMPDESRRMHILTRLDQLEALVNVSDTDIPLPIGGINHIGTDFQLTIIKASDLSEEIHNQHNRLNTAILLFGGERGIKLRNMEENIDGLQEIADNGDLRILKRLYIALQNATPAQYKWEDDPINNHMGSLRYMSYNGLFAKLSVALTHAAEKGYLEHIVNGLLNVIMLVGPEDIEPLRVIVGALLTKAQQGDLVPMEILMNKLLTMQQTPESYKNFKDALFHLIPQLSKVNMPLTAVLQGVPPLVSQPVVWNALTDSLVEDFADPQGSTFKFGANLGTLDDASWNMLRKLLGTLVLSKDHQNQFLLPPLMKLGADGYAKRTEEFSQLNTAMSLYGDDPRVVQIKPAELFKNIFIQSADQSGVGDSTAYLLLDPVRRQQLISVGALLSNKGDISGLSRLLIREIDNGHVDSVLHFIFDNLTSSSVPLSLGWVQ